MNDLKQTKELQNLLNCYNKREDLKTTFPEVEFGNYQALINWASDVCKNKLPSYSYEVLKNYTEWYVDNEKEISIHDRIEDVPQLKILLDIYHRRIDLMSTIHETDFQDLINWAAKVSNKRWEDKDYQLLKEYSWWYLQHEKPNTELKITSLVNNIYKITQFQTQISARDKKDNFPKNDYLAVLFLLTVENSLRSIVEVGVFEDSKTTITLANAASKINGHLWSINIGGHMTVEDKLKNLGLENYSTLVHGDLKQIILSWNKTIDHLFIHTNFQFEYENSYNELVLFEKFLKKGGYMTLHDNTSYDKILEGIKEFLHGSNSKFHFYNLVGYNELALLRKIS